jgi:N-acetylglucosaminyldiphosphoundecaprenol N-acetyl-beta-D-mannosaminyltransferase
MLAMPHDSAEVPSPQPTDTPGEALVSALERTPFGKIFAHRVTMAEAIDRIVQLCRGKTGGTVLTPNVDHVCLAETDVRLADAYAHTALSLVDGKPLVWLSRMMNAPLPEKVSGSDLAVPLAQRAAQEGLSVFLLGAKEGVGLRAADVLREQAPGLNIAGVLSPPLGFDKDVGQNADVIRTLHEANPDLVFVCFGAPKQELWMAQHADVLAPAVLLGLGGTLDFLAGDVRRAPAWMSDAGLEWLYRLAQEPTRLAGRYLVRDRAFAGIAIRAILDARRADATARLR